MFSVTGAGRAATSQNKDLKIVPDTGPLAGKEVYTNSYALLVGINQYAHLPRYLWLDYAVQDVTGLRDLLIRSYGFPAENVTVLTNANATEAHIRKALAQLADRRKIQPDDRLFIYFSGHGQTVKMPSGGDMGFLIPYDADVDLNDVDNPGPYLNTCIQMDTIWGYLQSSPAKHSLLVADACYSGILAKSRGVHTLSQMAIASYLSRRALQVMTAGRQGETSVEDPKWGHGAFTAKLLEELKARAAEPDQAYTTTDLFSAVGPAVVDLSGGKQTPQFGSHDTEGEFLFVTTKSRPVPPLRQDTTSGLTPDPSPEPPKTRRNTKDDAEMVFVPAGEFTMGSDSGEPEERPAHKVKLDAYWIYKNPVTVAQYKQFCHETGHPMPPKPERWASKKWDWEDDHPIVNVTWKDATEYCNWAKVRLPTEAEWEKAARGSEGFLYPWGNEFDPNKLWRSRENFGGVGEREKTARVESFTNGASPYGALDMAGNVWQWVADLYDEGYYKDAPKQNPTGPASNTGERVIRGGSWSDVDPTTFRSSHRFSFNPEAYDENLGFRCALSAK